MKTPNITLVAGGSACNAHCPYCVSRMTGKDDGIPETCEYKNLERALILANRCGATTCLITGKGEPLLHPGTISEYVKTVEEFEIPIVELQTNGLLLEGNKLDVELKEWHENGLNTIAISVAHWNRERNAEIFTPNGEYMNLEDVVYKLHEIGYLVRVTCTLMKHYIDDFYKTQVFVNHMKNYVQADQISLSQLRSTETIEDDKAKRVKDWVMLHALSDMDLQDIKRNLIYFDGYKKLMTLPHGAEIYDYKGISVCFKDCLTLDSASDSLRQLIYFPDGTVRYDWQFKGARLL